MTDTTKTVQRWPHNLKRAAKQVAAAQDRSVQEVTIAALSQYIKKRSPEVAKKEGLK